MKFTTRWVDRAFTHLRGPKQGGKGNKEPTWFDELDEPVRILRDGRVSEEDLKAVLKSACDRLIHDLRCGRSVETLVFELGKPGRFDANVTAQLYRLYGNNQQVLGLLFGYAYHFHSKSQAQIAKALGKPKRALLGAWGQVFPDLVEILDHQYERKIAHREAEPARASVGTRGWTQIRRRKVVEYWPDGTYVELNDVDLNIAIAARISERGVAHDLFAVPRGTVLHKATAVPWFPHNNALGEARYGAWLRHVNDRQLGRVVAKQKPVGDSHQLHLTFVFDDGIDPMELGYSYWVACPNWTRGAGREAFLISAHNKIKARTDLVLRIHRDVEGVKPKFEFQQVYSPENWVEGGSEAVQTRFERRGDWRVFVGSVPELNGALRVRW